jgi:signal-transduction protein with cAMP-binding, CBS, and nucleotidyltransferase domain
MLTADRTTSLKQPVVNHVAKTGTAGEVTFNSLSPATQAKLHSVGERTTLKKGDAVFELGAEANTVIVMLTGSASVTKGDVQIATPGADSLLGLQGLFADPATRTRGANIHINSNAATTLTVDYEKFKEIVVDDPNGAALLNGLREQAKQRAALTSKA